MKTLNEAMTSGGIDSWSNYIGDRSYSDWYMFLGRSRDSHILEESNFQAGLKALGGESDDVFIYKVNHWAYGWIEEILINPANADMVELANNIRKQLDDYPVLDEDDYSHRQWDYAHEIWDGLSIRERVELCQRFKIPVLEARHDYIPKSDNGSLFEWLTMP